jgi:hypothetical protein
VKVTSYLTSIAVMAQLSTVMPMELWKFMSSPGTLPLIQNGLMRTASTSSMRPTPGPIAIMDLQFR